KFNTVDATVLPQDASAREAYEIVSEEFPPYRESPIVVSFDGGGPGEAREFAREVGAVAGVSEVLPPRRLEGGITAIEAISTEPFASDASKETAERIRNLETPPGAPALVGGGSAEFVDFQSSLESHLPIAVAIIVIATLVILFLMTGSVVLPIKSLLMNVLN